MNILLLIVIVTIWITEMQIISATVNNFPKQTANVKNWQNHRNRQKRFLIFQNTGISKLVTGVTFPVDLSDKIFWRQLVQLINLQYQFPVPTTPIYWWNLLHRRAMTTSTSFFTGNTVGKRDEAQEFLYRFAEEWMNRQKMNGRICMQRAICENAQIHDSNGLFAELLQRFLMPHKLLNDYYLEALRAGKNGVQCHELYETKTACFLEQYLYTRETII